MSENSVPNRTRWAGQKRDDLAIWLGFYGLRRVSLTPRIKRDFYGFLYGAWGSVSLTKGMECCFATRF